MHALNDPPRATVAAELVAARDALLTAEGGLLDSTLWLNDARRLLQDTEDYVLLAPSGHLDGKNAEVRAAQLRDLTRKERRSVEQCEDARLRAVSALEQARATFSAVKVLARLLGGTDE
jgi:hypothetical protein